MPTLSQIWINKLATLLEHNQHSSIGRNCTKQAWSKTTKESSPSSFITVQFACTVYDTVILSLRTLQVIGLKWRLYDVCWVRQCPVGNSSNTATDEHACHWQVLHAAAWLCQAVSTQLIETCNTSWLPRLSKLHNRFTQLLKTDCKAADDNVTTTDINMYRNTTVSEHC